MPTAETLAAAVVGDIATAEMQTLAAELETQLAGLDVRHAAQLEKLDRLVSDGWFPDLVVVIQNWPDEFAARGVVGLLDQLPLARLVCCYGTWCLSDGRNRDIWPSAVRVPARVAGPRVARGLAVLRGELEPLPLTASRDEIYEFDHPAAAGPQGSTATLEQRSGECTVAIRTPDAEYRMYLRQLLETWGIVPVDGNEGGADVTLWDIDPWQPTTTARIESFHQANPHGAVIALMNHIHPEEESALLAAGVTAVLPKLAPHEQLLSTVADALRSAPTRKPN